MRSILVLATAFAIAACGAGSPAGHRTGGPSTTHRSPSAAGSRIDSPWPVEDAVHIDLWLNGWEMIQSDTNKCRSPARIRAGAATARTQARVSSGLERTATGSRRASAEIRIS